jgi:YVTN family beta-propeller protein
MGTPNRSGRCCLLSYAIAAVAYAVPCVVSAQTAFVNFEIAPVHGLEITPDGSKLLATNTADGRLEVFTLGAGLPVYAGSIPVGLEPVSVRARTSTEVWVVNQVSDTVSIIDLPTMNVVATLKPGNEPCDVVFVGSGAAQRAYVSVSRENLLRVFNPSNRSAAPTTVALQGMCPKALATDGARVFAAFWEAGNRSTVAPRSIVDDPTGPWLGQNPPPSVGSGGASGTFSPPLNPALPPGPPSSLILNREGNPGNYKDQANVVWDSKVPWALQEHGIAIYTPSAGTTTYGQNINNVNMALAIQPGNGKVSTLGHHLTNYVRFEPNHRSVFGRSFFGFFDPANPPGPTGAPGAGVADLNSHLYANGVSLPYTTNPTPAQVNLSVADPRAIAWRDASNAYIASMGTNLVVRISATGARQSTVAVGKGPVALAYDPARSRLYVLNRFDGAVTSINTSNDSVVGAVPFFDPTPSALKPGRDLFYNARLTSKLGIVSCNSCHVDTRSDMQSWDAGDPSGSMKTFDVECESGGGISGVCADFHPLKGPMMTQNLADTVGVGPLHWRGDREDVLAFSGGFPGFLGSAAPSVAQMQTLQALFASLTREPNPYRTITDALPTSVAGFTGDPANGQALFAGPAIGGAIASCTECHAHPSGGGTTVIPASFLGQSQSLKTPPLRDLYVKTGFDRSSLTSRRGFGFGHDGATESVASLLLNHFAPGASSQQRADIEAFTMCFPSGTHPAVGVQITFDAVNKNDPPLVSLLDTLKQLADAHAVGLVARGRLGGLSRGFVYEPGPAVMQSDRVGQTMTVDALRQFTAPGGEITFTVVPIGSERRLGIDRDADGFLDRDELDNGSNPADGASHPGVACLPTFALQPSDTVTCIGGTATLTVGVTGGSGLYAYQWRRAGVDIADQPGHVAGSGSATLTLQNTAAADAGSYDCVVTAACGTITSGHATVLVSPADEGSQGGAAGRDGVYDNNDFVVFIDLFFSADPKADLGHQGGLLGPDGLFDNNDFIVFIDQFFAGC